MATETDDARNQAKAKLEGVYAIIQRLNHAADCGEADCLLHDEDYDTEAYHDYDAARDAIAEYALSVEVRSDWHVLGAEPDQAEGEYRVVLCTGGPAVQIIGSLGSHGEPDDACLQYQDWGTPWTDYPTTFEEERMLLEYLEDFCFNF